MIIEKHYNNLSDRHILCLEYESQGYRMLHDHFDANWHKGDEPHGALIFTDEPIIEPEPTRNLYQECDEIKNRLSILENAQ